MRLNSILGLAAVAGAAYLIKSGKGQSFINEHRGTVESWVQKGEEALRNVTDKFRNQSVNTPPVS